MTDKSFHFTEQVILLTVLILAFYTQTTHLLSVPGLHFDEAWQGLFASRIAKESGFFPAQAMNSYTSPILHYLLAFSFKFFGSKLVVMRIFFSVINLTSLWLFVSLFKKIGENRAAIWFCLLWALLPLSVQNHRFYIELTSFHGFCLALIFWGVYFWTQERRLSLTLIALGFFLGVYSHILFFAIFPAMILTIGFHSLPVFRSETFRKSILWISILFFPLFLRAALDSHKGSAIGLLFSLIFLDAFILASLNSVKLDKVWWKIPLALNRTKILLLVLSLPFFVFFALLLWNGSWPYAQVTGNHEFFIPINLAILLSMIFFQLTTFWRRRRNKETSARIHFLLSANKSWTFFVCTFFFTSIFIFKPNARFYTLPLIACLFWISQRLSRIRNINIAIGCGILFTVFNLYLFNEKYIKQFESRGSTDKEFRFLFYKESARDFRPFQKVIDWVKEKNCLKTLSWVEDDRFGLQVQFLKLEHLQNPSLDENNCPWLENDLFFSHLPFYDGLSESGVRPQDMNPPFENVEYLYHQQSWGDLSLFLRKK